MATIDEALATLDPTPEGYEAAAEAVSSASPWGRHLTGVYMAMAIEGAFGAEGVVEAFSGAERGDERWVFGSNWRRGPV